MERVSGIEGSAGSRVRGRQDKTRFDARYWMLGAGALGRPRGRVWGGRREEGSGWGIQVYLWQIHFDIWQNKYNIVKFKNKIKKKQLIYGERNQTTKYPGSWGWSDVAEINQKNKGTF